MGGPGPRIRSSRGFGKQTVAFGALLAGALLLGACSGTTVSVPPPGPAVTTTTQLAPRTLEGTVYWAEPADAAPNYIFPMNAAYFSQQNIGGFQYLMYRPLYWFGKGGTAFVDYTKSIGEAPVWSNDDQTVTVNLRHYVWSDGEAVTGGSVMLWINMLKYAAANADWGDYTKGYFPDTVTSVSISPTSFSLDLNHAVNPNWFLYNELSQITPLPAAWDVTSLSGAPGSGGCSMTTFSPAPGGTKACGDVFNFLTSEAKKESSYEGSKLWGVIDGPWKLTSFDPTTGDIHFDANSAFTGTDKPALDHFVELAYTTDASEYGVLKRGDTIDVGYIPPNDLPANPAGSPYYGPNAPAVSGSYAMSVEYPYQFSYWVGNFENPFTGPLFRQLYIRQAIQDLIDQPAYIKAYDDGYALPTYGAVPTVPPTWADAQELSNPYPYDPTAAAALLTSHGWKVDTTNGSTCQSPGTGPNQCGAGIAKGEKLEFGLDWASGEASIQAEVEQMRTAELTGAGIKVDLSSSFNQIVGPDYAPCIEAQACSKWEAAYWVGGWPYWPDYLPTGEPLFYCAGDNPARAAAADSSSYCDPQANALINASTMSSSPTALYRYEDYIQKQLPFFWMPTEGTNVEVVNHLYIGPQNVFGNLNPEDWYWEGPGGGGLR